MDRPLHGHQMVHGQIDWREDHTTIGQADFSWNIACDHHFVLSHLASLQQWILGPGWTWSNG